MKQQSQLLKLHNGTMQGVAKQDGRQVGSLGDNEKRKQK